MIPAFWPITVAKRISIFYSFVIKVDYAQMLLFLILGNDLIYISYIPLKSYLYEFTITMMISSNQRII